MTSNLTQDLISNGEIQCIISSRSAERSSSETLRGRSLANVIDYAKRVRHDGIICCVDGISPPIVARNYNSLPTIAPPLLTPAPNIDDSCALPSAPSPAPIPSGGPILSQMVKEYAQHLKTRRRKPRSDNEVRDQMAVFNLLLDYLGDVLVKDVTHDRLKEFLNVADRLPRNRNKNPRYRDKSFQELLALQICEKEVLSITTINKYAGWITAFFKWLTNTGRLTFQPAYDLQKEKLIHPIDEAAPFSIEELNLIVSGPAFVTKKRRNRN